MTHYLNIFQNSDGSLNAIDGDLFSEIDHAAEHAARMVAGEGLLYLYTIKVGRRGAEQLSLRDQILASKAAAKYAYDGDWGQFSGNVLDYQNTPAQEALGDLINAISGEEWEKMPEYLQNQSMAALHPEGYGAHVAGKSKALMNEVRRA